MKRLETYKINEFRYILFQSYTIFVILNKYLLSMDIANINVGIMMTSIGLNILLEYIFLYHLDFGTR